MTNLTFIIPVRIDSEARNQNLVLIVQKLLAHPEKAFIIILEGDNQPRITGLPESERITYLFEKDENPVFFRTHYLNQMTALSQTPIIAVWDTDILVADSQITEAVELLRSGEADFVYPYDGRIFQVPPLLRDIYQEKNDLSILDKRNTLLSLLYGTNSYGGCFMASRNKYIEAGMENEHFYGWGPEDLERVKRWEILGYCIRRTKGAAFHLKHPILANSCSHDKETATQNNRELFRICSMTAKELRCEIATWQSPEYTPETILINPEN